MVLDSIRRMYGTKHGAVGDRLPSGMLYQSWRDISTYVTSVPALARMILDPPG